MESTSAAAAPSSSSAPSASTSAVPPSSLFNTDENRFLQDTLASAHSFDPFQHGAPGFKVPAVLPPGLIQGMAVNGNANTGGGGGGWPMQGQDSSSFSAFPVPDRSRTNSWAPGGTNESPPVQGQNESFVAFVRRTQGNTPFSTNTASQSPPHAPQYHHQHSQSFSGPSTGGGGAYGQNMAWKMQQLEALQAERRRYMESVGSSGGPLDTSASTVSPMDYQAVAQTSDAGPSGSSPAMSAHSRHPSHQSPPHPQAPGADLSTLGLSFPSSHDFPAATPPGGFPDGGGEQQMAGLHPQYQQQQHHQQQQQYHSQHHSPPPPNQLRGPIHRLKSGSVGRSSGSSSGGSNGSRPRQPSTSASTGAKPATSTDAGQTTAEYKPWPKAPSPSAPSTSYPPVHVDPSLVSRSLLTSNPSLARHAEAFYGREPAEERRRFQPHLVDLKERRREERKKKAEMMEEKKAKALQRQKATQDDTQGGECDGDDGGDDSGDEDGEGDKKRVKSSSANGAKKPAHILLTEAEKKANHIASEQKRRANIRKGYELLCQGVPALREALERGEEEGGGGGQASGDSMQLEIGGEKIDGRAGPRSEAVVLGKSVEHLRHLLEVHRDLRSRRDHARVKLARGRFGVDVVVKEDPNKAAMIQAQKGSGKGKKSGGAVNGKKKTAANGKDKGKATPVKLEDGQAAEDGNSMDVG